MGLPSCGPGFGVGYRKESYIGSVEPRLQAPGALFKVILIGEALRSAAKRLSSAPKLRQPPWPLSRLYRFQKSPEEFPTLADPVFALGPGPAPKSTFHKG